MPLLPTLLLLWSCAGLSAETLVDELRVVVFRPLDPEIAPGETTELEGVIADPEAAGYDWILWTCTSLGDTCLESESDEAVWTGLTIDTFHEDAPASGLFTGELTASPALFELASDEPVPFITAYALVCTEGTCPVIDLADANPEVGSAGDQELTQALSNPFALLERYPLSGVSLASWRVDVSTRDIESRRVHPTLGDCTFASSATTPRTVPAGGRLEVTCAVEGPFDADAALWGYGTAGGWEGQSIQVPPDTTEADPYTWIAPKDAADADDLGLWLVLTDGLGGLDWKPVDVTVTEAEE